MGCWMGALGRLTIVPEPDNDLIMEYVDFSKSACPKEYNEDEVFHNSWYFDENNRLASGIGKFAEPSVWYGYLKEEFFEPRGYQLYGDPVFVGEVDQSGQYRSSLGDFSRLGTNPHFPRLCTTQNRKNTYL